MFSCDELDAMLEGDDPRLRAASVRCLPGRGEEGTVLLLGVVHDHPASIGRTAKVLDAIAPDVLALELPPLAVPLFEAYAADVSTPPRLGGEMSAAIQAADDARIVGIDSPNRTYLATLLASVDRETACPALRDLASSAKQAVACRLGAVLARVTSIRLRIYTHLEYETTLLDTHTDQADHEREHLSQQQALLGAIKVPASRALIDDVRERTMASRLRALRAEGDVVAIVGMEHLDSMAEQLSTPTD